MPCLLLLFDFALGACRVWLNKCVCNCSVLLLYLVWFIYRLIPMVFCHIVSKVMLLSLAMEWNLFCVFPFSIVISFCTSHYILALQSYTLGLTFRVPMWWMASSKYFCRRFYVENAMRLSYNSHTLCSRKTHPFFPFNKTPHTILLDFISNKYTWKESLSMNCRCNFLPVMFLILCIRQTKSELKTSKVPIWSETYHYIPICTE